MQDSLSFLRSFPWVRDGAGEIKAPVQLYLPTSEIQELIGFFVNTLVLRAELEPEASFTELLAQIRQQTLDAYAHQDVPFERLVDELVTERDMLHSPLFRLVCIVHHCHMGLLQIYGPLPACSGE